MALEVDSTLQHLRALSHPLRLRILALLSGTAMSSAELARELNMSHAAVSFHVRQLVAAGYLHLVETRSVRGGRERRYRHHVAGLAEWEHEDAQLSVRAVSEELLRRLRDVPSSNWRLFGDAEVWVKPQVWDEAIHRIAAVFTELHDAGAEPHTPGSLHVSATAMLFAIDGKSEGACDPPGDQR